MPAGASVEVAAGATLDLGARAGVAVASLALAKGAVITVDAAKAGDVLVAASSIEDAGAILNVGGVASRLRLRIVDDGDGTKTLMVAGCPGLLVIFR